MSVDGTRIGGSVFFNHGFRADGEVRMVDADIRGELNCLAALMANPDGVALPG